MGDPKFSRQKYDTPSHPWQGERIKAENEIVKKYGLKNKREVWKAQSKLRNLRQDARRLMALSRTGSSQARKEIDQLMNHVARLGLLPPDSSLDDVLALELESILSRRFQTLLYTKGFARTPGQARQFIVHGHAAIADRRVTIPGYLVYKSEEDDISYNPGSPISNELHPARPSSEEFPVAVEQKPAVAVENPVAVEQKPAVAVENPVAVEQKPAVAVEKPVAVEQKPAVAVEKEKPVVPGATVAAEKSVAVEPAAKAAEGGDEK